MQKDLIDRLNSQFKSASPQDVLKYFLNGYKGKIALASSLSLEDQVLTDMVYAIDKNIKIFTLDTGRLFQETYDLIERTNARFDIKISIYFPDKEFIEKITTEKGPNFFYKSIEDRKQCCQIRKIEPLKRAFKNLDIWICGLRQEQAVTRSELQLVEWDAANQLIKLNPLYNWTEEQVWQHIKENHIPYNTLHDKGYPSIGCLPCTRPIKEGEDIRAGRWWWENPEQKECGLHKK